MTDTIPAPLQTMRDITGTLEEPGSDDNPVIIGWADEIASKFPEMKLYCAQYTHDSIPWCGLTIAYVMAHNGIRPQYGSSDTEKFLWARAWEDFGTAREGEPQLGDILVFPGHVSMYDGRDGDYYLCRGGNQSDQVKVSRYPASSVLAVRVPPAGGTAAALPKPPVIKPNPKEKRYTSITATVFGGSEDPNTSAYDGHEIDDDEFGVALPARFTGKRPKVRVFNGERSVDCDIVDVGPWNTNDKYWESDSRPQAESGEDITGRTTNHAGIDLTPAAALALGINGKGTVDWMFIDAPTPNSAREEKVVRDGSRKMRLFANIRMFVQFVIATVSGWFSLDNFGLVNSFLGIGHGAVPASTLLTLLMVGGAAWILVNYLDKLSMEDFKAGRWMPSELHKDNPLTTEPSNVEPTK